MNEAKVMLRTIANQSMGFERIKEQAKISLRNSILRGQHESIGSFLNKARILRKIISDMANFRALI